MHELRINQTEIPGLLVLHLGVQYNDDGWFKESWHRATMTALGLPDFHPVQFNVRHVEQRGVTRGFYAEPWDRLITVVRGRAMGAWVDLRPGASYGRTVTADLDPAVAVFVPRGVANAHQILEDHTTMAVLLDHHWTPESRQRYSTVNLFDPRLAIPWPISRDRAIVSHSDSLNPLLADATPYPPRRTLIAGTDTPLGRALLGAWPGATGVPSSALDGELDVTEYATVVHAVGGAGGVAWEGPGWSVVAGRAQRLAGLARRHGLGYVQVSADSSFERDAPEHAEIDRLSLATGHGQAVAVAEVVAGGVPRHLIVRTGWVLGPDEGFLHDTVAAARHGRPLTVDGDARGRLTYASQLVAGIRHLLDVGAEAGVYNLTGDGRAVSWLDAARRIYLVMGADPGLVDAGIGGDAGAGALLDLARIKATGFRPGNSWLELTDHVPRGGSVGGASAPDAVVPGGSGPGAAGSADVAPARAVPRGAFRVLFVCTANICRSAYADVAANAAAPAGLEFASAGIRALVGEGIDPPMAAELHGRGKPDAHVARQLTRQMVEDADLILTMAAEHRRYILDEWPGLGRKAFVIGHVSRVLADAPEGMTLDGVVDYLWRHRTSEESDEVADPYRRGAEAAGVAARAIDGHLEVIVGALSRMA